METASISVSSPIGSRRDYFFGIISGFAIGILLLPILKTAKPELFFSLKFVIVPIFTVLVPLALVIASWISYRIPLVWQLAKFIITGALNTLVDIGTLSYMLFLASVSSYHIASNDILFTLFVPIAFFTLYKGISFLIANTNSYFWNKYWTFGASNTQKKSSTEFIQFLIISFIGFIINISISSLIFGAPYGTNRMSIDQWALISAVIGSIVGFTWNFIGYKFFVFKI